MRILFLTHSFNSLAQRLYLELTARGHEVSVEFDISDAVTLEAVALYRPDLIIAPFLKRAIPEAIWRKQVCLIVHPGIKGDRGPSALDWAILNGESEWGVTVLQAAAEMDAGDIWAEARFAMRAASKSSLYRNEVTEAAVAAVLEAVTKFESGDFVPEPLDYSRPDIRGQWHPIMRQEDRAIAWRQDDTAAVLRKIRSADGFPGVLDEVLGLPCYLYDAHPAEGLRGTPGEVIAHNNGAICRATTNGAVWIGHLKEKRDGELAFKLPAAMVLGDRLASVPEVADLPPPFDKGGLGGISQPPPSSATNQIPPNPPLSKGGIASSWRDIRYEEKNSIGFLHFDFYNGAMGTQQCERLLHAYLAATRRDTRVIVLAGGADFWSNGIHLNLIEAADSPADASWANINAINDLARAIIETDNQVTLSALCGNAGAGGAFLALAADRVVAREGVVLNPHYKAMGNLYGSEYWTYLLPRRVGAERAAEITENRLPVGARQADKIGLIGDCFAGDAAAFWRQVEEFAGGLATDAPDLLAEKRQRRGHDEAQKPLADYRAEELANMKRNFYGFDPSYHVARYNFVHKVPHSRTPRHLALHRKVGKKPVS
ncbi:MAG: hydrogenase maturation protein [Sulfuricella sp.]|nr:hydrogenase maturation protein [Sulfuricella sp.]